MIVFFFKFVSSNCDFEGMLSFFLSNESNRKCRKIISLDIVNSFITCCYCGRFLHYFTMLICRNVILQRFMSLEESQGHSIQSPENKCWIFWSCVWDLSHLCFCCYGNPSTCFWLFIINSALWIFFAKIYFDWQRWFDRITLWVVYQIVRGEKSI